MTRKVPDKIKMRIVRARMGGESVRHKFVRGDIVGAMNNCCYEGMYLGQNIGIVVDDVRWRMGVRWRYSRTGHGDNGALVPAGPMHGCNGFCRQGYGWYVASELLFLVRGVEEK